jgi:hypothetical protein
VFIAGVIFVGSFLRNISPSVRLLGEIAWLAGALGISLKGTGALLGIGLKEVEGWLWDIELDGSVAVAATCLPHGKRPPRVRGGSLGELSPKAKPDAQPQQVPTRHQARTQAAN